MTFSSKKIAKMGARLCDYVASGFMPDELNVWDKPRRYVRKKFVWTRTVERSETSINIILDFVGTGLVPVQIKKEDSHP
jgi:hypothetical protein